MPQPSLRVRVGDRVVRLTSDGIRCSRHVATVVKVEPRADAPGRAWVRYSERLGYADRDHVHTSSGRLNKDGSATVAQTRAPRAEELV